MVEMPRACISGSTPLNPHSDNGIAVPGTSRCRAHTRTGSRWAQYAAQHPEQAVYSSPLPGGSAELAT